jgi:hypothetical protein
MKIEGMMNETTNTAIALPSSTIVTFFIGIMKGIVIAAKITSLRMNFMNALQ